MDCAGYEQPFTSKCSRTDNNQVDILLQDMGIPRKEQYNNTCISIKYTQMGTMKLLTLFP